MAPLLRAGIRRAAQLPARLRPRPGLGADDAEHAAQAQRDRAAGRHRSDAHARTGCWICSRTSVRCTGRAAEGRPRNGAAHRQHAGVPAVLPAVAGRGPGGTAGLVPPAAGAGAAALRCATDWTAPPSSRRRSSGCSALSAGSPSSCRRLSPSSSAGCATATSWRSRPTQRCGPGLTAWPPSRVASGWSQSWPATCGSTTSTSRCWRSPSQTEYAAAERDLDALRGRSRRRRREPSGSTGSWPAHSRCAQRCCAGGAAATTPGCAECCWRSTPAGSTGSENCAAFRSASTTGGCSARPTTTTRAGPYTSSPGTRGWTELPELSMTIARHLATAGTGAGSRGGSGVVAARRELR